MDTIIIWVDNGIDNRRYYRMYSKLKSFFFKPQPAAKHLQLFRLQSLPSRSLQSIEQYIFTNFRPLPSKQITEELDQLMTKLQAETSLRGIITYLLLFKDLICIGPKRISEQFLNYKLKFEDNPILSKFYSYVVKIAYTHDIYIQTLQIYNNNKGMFSNISTIKGYKTLNYLMEIFSTIEAIDSEQKRYSKLIVSDPETKSVSPLIIYNRIRICLIADLILYFTYIKHAILTAPLRIQQTKIQQISLVQEFTKISLQFKRILYESNIQNSYFSIAEQKSIVNTKREIQKKMMAEKEPGMLTVRDANRTYTAEKEKGEFSFGHFTCREV